jgi:hypothetical protein
LTEQPVVEEPKPLVNVGQDPGVGVNVKAVDHLKQEIGLENLGPYLGNGDNGIVRLKSM